MTRVGFGVAHGLGLVLVVWLATWNLEAWPLTWFDEGVHLKVPKALVLFGVYADYSSEGFRHYGPTMSVGPTVMLPIAAMFKVFGVGLLAGRAVIAAYLVGAIVCYFILARRLGGERFAWVATALVVAAGGVDIVLYGRQALGEVPALAFLLAGIVQWHRAFEHPTAPRLTGAGCLFGLAVLTKSQAILLLAPGLVLAWLVNRAWHRTLPDRVFLWPLALIVVTFGTWQLVGVMLLGPATAAENLALMQRAAAGAAFSFSLDHVKRALSVVTSFWMYGALLLPAVAHGAVRGIGRSRDAFRWMSLWCFVVPALAWFLLASVGWPRYAFFPAALGALLATRLLADLTGGWQWPSWRGDDVGRSRAAVATAAWALIGIVVVVPLGRRVGNIANPPENVAREAAAFLDEHVPLDALIETWEPELGFLTNHRYHFPPSALLIDAVAYRFGTGPSPGDLYDFTSGTLPDIVVEGEFSRWVGVYPRDRLDEAYHLLASIGPYLVFGRRAVSDAPEHDP